jgi:Tfp pilus assembly protein PilF
MERRVAEGRMKKKGCHFMLLRSLAACLLFGATLAGTTLRAQGRGGTSLVAATTDGSPVLPPDSAPKSQSTVLEDPTVVFKQAVEFQKAGNLEWAARQYQRILSKRPEMPEVLNNLGVIFQALGDPVSAQKEYEEALRLEPEYGTALNNLASLLYGEGKYSQARDLWLKAIAKDPLESEFRFNLALNYLKTGEPEKSIESIKKSLMLNPKYALANYVLGGILQEQGDYKGALKAYLSYLESRPDPPTAALADAQHQVAELKAYLGLFQDQD